MSERPFHVVVIGGGIGGLCLAQGLKKAGVSVAVYERDLTSSDRLGGYRLQINPAGSRALNECLPPAVWEAFVATAGKPGNFAFLSENFEELAVVEEEIMYPETTDAAESHHAVHRDTLRHLLLSGLGDVVQFGKKFERYERTSEGKVTAFFADGMSATGNVLVGADGANSRVRKQYLPRAERVQTEAVGVGLKLSLTEKTRAWLPPRIIAGMNMIVAPDPWFLFTAVFERRQGPGESLSGDGFVDLCPELPGVHGDYIFCAFVAHRDAHPAGDLNDSNLQRLVETMIGDWHPDLCRIVAESDPDSVMLVPITTSVPVEPWESTNVTVLGDAIHSMPPSAGLGGNTALRDANLLCRKLTAVFGGELPLLPAIHAYEAEMIDYGFDAVRESLKNTRQGISGNRISLAAFKTALRVCQAVPPLKHMMFKDAWAEPARARSWEREKSGDQARSTSGSVAG